MENFGTARDMVMALKNKYWKDALFTYKGVEKRVCFHSREIRGKREAFNPDLIDYPSFITDLSQLMKDVPITLYAAHIDKVRHVSIYLPRSLLWTVYDIRPGTDSTEYAR